MSSASPAPRILIVGPAWVGDMVMAQVLFKFIKQQQSDVRVDVLAPAWTQALLAFMPEVDDGIVLPFRHGELKLWQRYRFAKSLKRIAYQQVIVLPNSLKSALIPFFANIAKRTGWLGEQRWGLINDVRHLDKSQWPLMIQRFAALALPAEYSLPEHLPNPRLQVSQEQQQGVLLAQSLSTAGKPVLAICPGAEYGESKRWPPEHFAAVARAKVDEGWQVWIFGTAKEFAIAEKIQQELPHQVHNLAGRTSLFEAVVLLSMTDAVVTNDSGLMHVAAALDKPLFAVYGSSSTAFTPPLSAKAHTLSLALSCSPCFKRECPLEHHACMQQLSPQKVLDSMASILIEKHTRETCE